MHANSLDTYDSIIEKLPRARAAVMACIVESSPITRQGIADQMGIPINRVTGRVRELLDSGEIIEQGTVIYEGKPRALLKPKPLSPQQQLF
jgi:predicted transcriptional regulator